MSKLLYAAYLDFMRRFCKQKNWSFKQCCRKKFLCYLGYRTVVEPSLRVLHHALRIHYLSWHIFGARLYFCHVSTYPAPVYPILILLGRERCVCVKCPLYHHFCPVTEFNAVQQYVLQVLYF